MHSTREDIAPFRLAATDARAFAICAVVAYGRSLPRAALSMAFVRLAEAVGCVAVPVAALHWTNDMLKAELPSGDCLETSMVLAVHLAFRALP